MSNPDEGTDDGELCEADVFELVRELGSANHFTRWLAIMRLENEGAWPINSKTVMKKLLEMTGDLPGQDSVIRSMNRLKDVGVLEKEEIDRLERHHWHLTEFGWEIGYELIALWNEGLGCPEAADALRACADNDSDEDDVATE